MADLAERRRLALARIEAADKRADKLGAIGAQTQCVERLEYAVAAYVRELDAMDLPKPAKTTKKK